MERCVICFCTFKIKVSVFRWSFFCSVTPFQVVETKVLPFDKLHFLLSGHGFVAFTFINKVIFFAHSICGFAECGLTKPFLITTSIPPFLFKVLCYLQSEKIWVAILPKKYFCKKLPLTLDCRQSKYSL